LGGIGAVDEPALIEFPNDGVVDDDVNFDLVFRDNDCHEGKQRCERQDVGINYLDVDSAIEAITALRDRVKGMIDETLTAGRLPKAHRWDRPLTHREAV
jgi:hypothetical protein